jgi:hypothetical protein
MHFMGSCFQKCLIPSLNTVLIRLVAKVKISLLLKIQWQEHDYLSEH